MGWTGKKCPRCKGVGEVYIEYRDSDGACPDCAGTGEEYDFSAEQQEDNETPTL